MNTICLAVVALAATPLLSVSAVSAYPASPADARSGLFTRIAEACPQGQHWEEAGYVAEGKWRPAHCARDGGRE